jgi:hypothetical protein
LVKIAKYNITHILGHKRRLQQLKDPQHTQRDAELAAGLGIDK